MNPTMQAIVQPCPSSCCRPSLGHFQSQNMPRHDLAVLSGKMSRLSSSRIGPSRKVAAVLDMEKDAALTDVLVQSNSTSTNGSALKLANGKPLSVSGDSDLATLKGQYIPNSNGSVGIEVDAVSEAELKENGFRSTRRTKLICTIGPASCEFHQLEALASGGMNVARINMCHGTREWHRNVIRNVRKLNEERGYAVAIMMDTEGSEIHMGDLGGEPSTRAEDGEIWTFTVRACEGARPEHTLHVNYEGFTEDVHVGDELMVDGGMVRFEVVEKLGPDVKCRCTDPGLLLPRANLTFWRGGHVVRERNAMLPTISSKDWLDIDFGIAEGVDLIAISFVKSAEVIKHLKSYIATRSLEGGDLGAQILLEQVPSVHEKIVKLCR